MFCEFVLFWHIHPICQSLGRRPNVPPDLGVLLGASRTASRCALGKYPDRVPVICEKAVTAGGMGGKRLE